MEDKKAPRNTNVNKQRQSPHHVKRYDPASDHWNDENWNVDFKKKRKKFTIYINYARKMLSFSEQLKPKF